MFHEIGRLLQKMHISVKLCEICDFWSISVYFCFFVAFLLFLLHRCFFFPGLFKAHFSPELSTSLTMLYSTLTQFPRPGDS